MGELLIFDQVGFFFFLTLPQDPQYLWVTWTI